MEHAEVEPNTVLSEYHRGYFLQDRLIRPAMVVVSKRPADAPVVEDVGNADVEASVEDTPIAVDSTGEAHVSDASDSPSDELQ